MHTVKISKMCLYLNGQKQKYNDINAIVAKSAKVVNKICNSIDFIEKKTKNKEKKRRKHS